MPKITFKKAFFRIFWKILVKTGPQSLYLCGFPEASVEMEVAPFRALTQDIFLSSFECSKPVEMEVAPFRPLTQCYNCNNQRDVDSGRNEARPTQGIVTEVEQTRGLSCSKRKFSGLFPFVRLQVYKNRELAIVK